MRLKRSRRCGAVVPGRVFTLFPKLPAELRSMIWESTFEPRLVDLQPNHKSTSMKDKFISKLCDWPVVLSICQESRHLGELHYPQLEWSYQVRINYQLDTLYIPTACHYLTAVILRGLFNDQEITSIRQFALNPVIYQYGKAETLPDLVAEMGTVDDSMDTIESAILEMTSLKEFKLVLDAASCVSVADKRFHFERLHPSNCVVPGYKVYEDFPNIRYSPGRPDKPLELTPLDTKIFMDWGIPNTRVVYGFAGDVWEDFN